MMKTTLILFLLLLPVSAFSQPSIHVESQQHDFGSVNQDNKLIHVFTIENKGDQDLVIEKIKSS
jgi:hypothetical protein